MLKILSVALALTLSVCISSYAKFAEHCLDIQQSTIRIHIIPNSNSDIDQQVKISLRDHLLSMQSDIFYDCTDYNYALATLYLKQTEIEDLLLSYLQDELGCDYGLSVNVTKVDFPTRHYEGYSLPAGEYVSLQILLGEAVGENWWCVIYPSICLPVALEQTNPYEPIVDKDYSDICTCGDGSDIYTCGDGSEVCTYGGGSEVCTCGGGSDICTCGDCDQPLYSYSPEQYEIISHYQKYQIKFKIVEVFSQFANLL